jgi:hypothetical protein
MLSKGTSDKDYEAAYLFKEFIREINQPEHEYQNKEYLSKKSFYNRSNSYSMTDVRMLQRKHESVPVDRMAERSSPIDRTLERSSPIDGTLDRSSPIDRYNERHNNIDRFSIDKFMESDNANRYSKHARSMSQPGLSENYCNEYNRKRSLVDLEIMNEDSLPKNPRIRFKSYDFSMEPPTADRDLMQHLEPPQCFICAYCEAKYVYKRCLVNHLIKSHRKILKK